MAYQLFSIQRKLSIKNKEIQRFIRPLLFIFKKVIFLSYQQITKAQHLIFDEKQRRVDPDKW
jgi:hypothetical protein